MPSNFKKNAKNDPELRDKLLDIIKNIDRQEFSYSVNFAFTVQKVKMLLKKMIVELLISKAKENMSKDKCYDAIILIL